MVERETDGTSTIIAQDLGRVWVIWTQQTNLRCSRQMMSFSWLCARQLMHVLQSEIGSKCFAVLDKKASSGLASTWTNFED